ncbi:energy-coupling factor ABC transporter ATP-binding protein [Desulforamulus hydrothermalis]|uniref:ABC transporter related protein n=1 Tax=Desulforamulus hydrothermalis Lam5 = DSM 18033 TaxID=1121428 RepID=K8E0I2_9FIRM|nr:ABC transporter ATP-binding protein [Desulforamulus hydrothermalis]CCO09072.1 ABC transporter related protein [Desulforamulus hydrothermalis Lam5 = DSM 18033]SHG78384.1 energy-coupling factor transport system ATP-binding protein [Desulforamulus hydrothermalis Lam5 = DSM 18033]
MTKGAAPVVCFQQFSYRYPNSDFYALKNINLQLHKGSIVGLIGPTGAGKTTLIKSVNGIIPHTEGGTCSGQVLLNGCPTVNLSTASIGRLVGTVMDDPESQIICLDVEQELVFGMENYGVPPEQMEQRLTAALAGAGISHLRYRSTGSLSGGQKQRLAIAAALALLPEILVLDEPTSELDPLGTEEIFAVLKEINRQQGITVLVAEQKTELLARYCDQLVILSDGEIALAGTPREVFGNPKVYQLGVTLPQVTELAWQLNRDSCLFPVTLEEGVDFCRTWLSGGGGKKCKVSLT